MMSPARASSIGFCFSANISTMRPIFSRLPRVVFVTDMPFASTPEYTRTNVSAPYVSLMTLNARPENGSSSEHLRSPIGLPSASTVLMAATSVGAGM